jgi:hypothetical protein
MTAVNHSIIKLQAMKLPNDVSDTTSKTFYIWQTNRISYRLFRGRKRAECAFGTLGSNFRIFQRISSCNQGPVEFVNISHFSCSCLFSNCNNQIKNIDKYGCENNQVKTVIEMPACETLGKVNMSDCGGLGIACCL